jgi:hypothetical protein
MNAIIEFDHFLYAYCTDFIINLANIFNLSYYEINFIIFCLLYPVLVFGSFSLYIIQRISFKGLVIEHASQRKSEIGEI